MVKMAKSIVYIEDPISITTGHVSNITSIHMTFDRNKDEYHISRDVCLLILWLRSKNRKFYFQHPFFHN